MATVTLVKRPLKRQKGKYSYIVQFVDPLTKEKRHYKAFRKWKDADDARTRLKTQLEGGDIPARYKELAKKNGKTFGDFCDEREADWERRVKEGSLAQSSMDGYLYPLHAMRGMWGNKPIGMIHKTDILDFRADLAERYSPAWSNRNLFVCKQVFKLAVEDNVIKHDPTEPIRYLSEKKHERTIFLYPEQVDALLAAASRQKTRHYMVLVILLAVEHGCSCQEILDLKISDINVGYKDVGTIRFHRTKNDMTRYHWIMPRSREALLARIAHVETMRRRRDIKIEDEYVVGRLNGTRRGNFRKAWKTICKECGFVDLHFHDNRHTYCTNIVLAGGSLKSAAAMIGHKDLRMTNRYANLEGLMDNPVQGLLADHYGKAGNMD